LLGLPSGAKAINALNFTVPAATTTTYIVGAPELTLTYCGTGVSRAVYAQLVDDTTGLVLGQSRHADPNDVGRADPHGHRSGGDGGAHVESGGVGDPATGRLGCAQIWSLVVLNVSSMQLALPTADTAAISSPSVVPLTIAA
jgi:ABC-2 type transport system ATP-binding protein